MGDIDDFGIPYTGGNTYYTKAYIDAKDALTKTYSLTKASVDKISNKLSSEEFTYSLWFLLQQQADYFTNLVRFRFYDKTLTENVYKAIRCGVIYGRSALWLTTQGVIPLYINKMEYDNFSGNPVKMSACLIDSVFSQKEVSPLNHLWIEFVRNDVVDEFKNIYIFNSTSTGFGGLIRWNPFLKQLQNLLKMLYTHSYSYLKFITYEVRDTSFVDSELDLFFNINTPFLVNLGDNTLLQNKFKEFNFSNSGKNEFFDYLQNFLNTYYSLIGRRYNVDFKKERNVSDEVNASQDNFNILQNELKQYIYLMLDWIVAKTNMECIYDL